MNDNILEFPSKKKSEKKKPEAKKGNKPKKVEVTKSFVEILEVIFNTPDLLIAACEHDERMESALLDTFDLDEDFFNSKMSDMINKRKAEEVERLDELFASYETQYREELAEIFDVDLSHILIDEDAENNTDFMIRTIEGRVFMDIEADEEGFSITPKLAQFSITENGVFDYIEDRIITPPLGVGEE